MPLIASLKKSLTKLFLIFTLSAISLPAHSSPSRTLTILAEQNMAVALTKIARVYSQISNVIVSVNFGTSYDLVNAVDSGDPSDLFISAHESSIETLKQKGLVDVYNIGYIASDNITLATDKRNLNAGVIFKPESSLEEALQVLNQKKAALIIDNEDTSSGMICNNYLKPFSLDRVRLIKKLPEDKTPIVKIIKNNPQHYALMLSSQSANNENLDIIATKENIGTFYQALVIAGNNMEVAREFVKFLKGKDATKIFRESGFVAN